MEKQKDQVSIFEFKEGFEYTSDNSCYRRVGNEIQVFWKGEWKAASFHAGIPLSFKISKEHVPSKCPFCVDGKLYFFDGYEKCDECGGTSKFKKENFTCNKCDFIACPVRWDGYNINNCCLYER